MKVKISGKDTAEVKVVREDGKVLENLERVVLHFIPGNAFPIAEVVDEDGSHVHYELEYVMWSSPSDAAPKPAPPPPPAPKPKPVEPDED